MSSSPFKRDMLHDDDSENQKRSKKGISPQITTTIDLLSSDPGIDVNDSQKINAIDMLLSLAHQEIPALGDEFMDDIKVKLSK